jgi:hypothetical protein
MLPAGQLGMTVRLLAPSKAKHDDGGDLPSSSRIPSWKENEDEPTLVTVPLPVETAYLVGSRAAEPKQESSTVEGCEGLEFARQLTWGQRNHETTTKWENTTIPQPNYLHRSCHICETSVCTFNSSTRILCHQCKKSIKEFDDLFDTKTDTREGGDDEQEFQFMGIPIAGENDGDTDEEWASDESEHDEDNSPQGRLTNNATFAINVDEHATRNLAFQVGPVRDGIVVFNTLPPASLTPNYYTPLSIEDKPNVFQCMNSAVVSTTPPQQIRKAKPSPFKPIMVRGTPSPQSQPQTWSNATDDELQRIFSHNAVTSVTNSQRLAQPWKIRRRDENNKRKHELRVIIEQQATYIESSTQTSPPSTKSQASYSLSTSLNPTRRQTRNETAIHMTDQPALDHPPNQLTDSETLAIYYQVFNRHRPEMGESNAESAHRTNIIDDEVRSILTKRRKRLVTNNVQDIDLQTSHRLYDNQDKRRHHTD